MKNPHGIQVGDGIVLLEPRVRLIVRALVTKGIETGTATDDDNDVVGVIGEAPLGSLIKLHNDEFRRENFGEFLTRPSGMGRTKWRAMAAMFVLFTTIGTFCLLDGGEFNPPWSRWAVVVFCYGMVVGQVWFAWMNYVRKWV